MPSFRLVFLGTGNAFNSDGRGSPSIWLEPREGPPCLVDAGPTALAAMEEYGLSPDAVEKVFFTHLHGDHTAGWPFLLLHAAFVARRSRPIEVFGSCGTKAQLEQLAASCYPELVAADRLRFPVRYHELPVAKATGIAVAPGLTVDIVPMEHHPSSIGYRFHCGGLSLGVSGDTGWCPDLEELGRGCDALIVECSSVEKQKYAHVSLEELRANRSRLGAPQVVLVHLSDAVVRALDADPIPGVRATHDGLQLDI